MQVGRRSWFVSNCAVLGSGCEDYILNFISFPYLDVQKCKSGLEPTAAAWTSGGRRNASEVCGGGG